MNVSFTYQSAQAKVEMTGPMEGVLHSVYSLHRRRGHARNVLEMVMSWADRNAIVLYLDVGEYGSPRGMTNEQLVEFYRYFGFEPEVPQYTPRPRMVRDPIL